MHIPFFLKPIQKVKHTSGNPNVCVALSLLWLRNVNKIGLNKSFNEVKRNITSDFAHPKLLQIEHRNSLEEVKKEVLTNAQTVKGYLNDYLYQDNIAKQEMKKTLPNLDLIENIKKNCDMLESLTKKLLERSSMLEKSCENPREIFYKRMRAVLGIDCPKNIEILDNILDIKNREREGYFFMEFQTHAVAVYKDKHSIYYFYDPNFGIYYSNSIRKLYELIRLKYCARRSNIPTKIAKIVQLEW
ncbi:YopT-type cysteine protease domain-containing protein [Francisella adeliensis]|nr:YopT-type cysteine protease domain-containing protein [Francisella adeliensis]MBK2086287.1 hypothetical protein [Francisella adeliensis]MBK2096504.1 hypothetical protein [Francisella adeliensis]